MRNMLIRLLLVVGLLGGGYARADISVTGFDGINDNYHTYAYDGVIDLWGNTTGVEEKGYKNWGAFFIFSSSKNYDGSANPDPASCGKRFPIWQYHPSAESVWDSYMFPFPWEYNDPSKDMHVANNDVFHKVDVCSAAMTWIDVRRDRAWIIHPYYPGFQIGPDKSVIKQSSSLVASHVPNDLVWEKGNDYTLRLYISSVEDVNLTTPPKVAFISRPIKYMGKGFAKDDTESEYNQKSNNPGYFVIRISPNSPSFTLYSGITPSIHYFFVLDCNTSVKNSVRNLGTYYAGYQKIDGTYKSAIDLHLESPADFFKVGDTYEAMTTCTSRKDTWTLSSSATSNIALLTDRYKDSQVDNFTHYFKVDSINNVKVVRIIFNIINSLNSSFLSNGGIHVTGRFDESASDNPPFHYAVNNGQGWLSPDNIKWNPEGNSCTKCFSFDIPASKLPANDKLALVQILPDLPTDQQKAQPDVAAFSTLSDFIEPKFYHSDGNVHSCGLSTNIQMATDNSGVRRVKIQLKVNHAIDNVSGYISLPKKPVRVSYEGNGEVSYSQQVGGASGNTTDIQLDGSKDDSWVRFTVKATDNILKPGIYVISLPVAYPISSGTSGNGELSMHLDAMNSMLLKRGPSYSVSANSGSIDCTNTWVH